jgi:hypothetical protein
MEEEYTTIRIGKKERDKLEQLRKKESYSDVVSRLLDDTGEVVAKTEPLKIKRKKKKVATAKQRGE